MEDRAQLIASTMRSSHRSAGAEHPEILAVTAWVKKAGSDITGQIR